jgi:RNA polymerase sigma-70 factor (ECF subfamily)
VAAGREQQFINPAGAPHRATFEKMLTHHVPRFRLLAMRWLRNREDAEDAVQEALLLAFEHIDEFHGRAQLSTWVTAIVINSVRMQLRRRGRSQMVPLENGTD